MEHAKLFEELKRLLMYSGREVSGISLTADGVIAKVIINGQTNTIFITPEVPKLLQVR